MGYQISKIKTHLDAGDRKNAKVYKEYASVFKQSGTNGKRFSFDALMFDQVMRYRVRAATGFALLAPPTQTRTLRARRIFPRRPDTRYNSICSFHACKQCYFPLKVLKRTLFC